MEKTNRRVNMDIDESTLIFIDEAAKKQLRSRTALMVYATLKYIKEVEE